MKNNVLIKFLHLLGIIVIAWSLLTPQSLAVAQVPFPRRPVYLWAMFPPGGVIDVEARVIAESAEQRLGQKVLVINKPGGAGAVGTSLLAKEKTDGYTVGITADTPFTRSPYMMDLGYDPFRDFCFILRVGIGKACFGVRADSPFKKWADLVKWAKENPGQLVYGHMGKGSLLQLDMVTIAKKEGFFFKDVPFAGDTPTVSALLGGHVMLAGANSTPFESHVRAGTLRILMTDEKEGVDFAPDATTFEKMHYLGLPQAFHMIYGPAGIAGPVRKVLEEAFIDAIKGEKFKEIAKRYDIVVAEPLTGETFRDYVKKSYLAHEQLMKDAGLYKSERK